MHYVFLTTGSWERNPSLMRARALGREFLDRGITVTYAVDDVPFNRTGLDVDPRASVAYTSDLGALSQIPARRRTLERLSPDFVHTINPAPKSCSALWGSKIRLIADWDEWPVRRPHPWQMTPLLKYVDHWFRNRAALNVVCSTYMRDEFRRLYGVEAAYIPYATYIDAQPETTSPFDVRTAVYMGYLQPIFDHDLIFEAARQLRDAGKPHPLTFIGGGPDVEQWREYVRQHDLRHVAVKGYVSDEDRWRHLRHAHVLLFPIRPTPGNLARCPAKTYAYAQARRPVITNRVGEVPNVLGDVPTYVETTSDAFAEAIDQAMSRDLADVDYHVERHNWAARAEALLAALPR
jgi:glycosyltransferase involved in cell wall biosynthesis